MYKVMLIDDEESLQDAIKRLVIAGGYAFCGARDALEGREVLLREKPDLLLLDVMLPTVNGFDFCRRLRDEGRHIPVIFLSAKNDIVDKTVGFKAGADDYVTKPFDAEELLLRIEANIRRHRESIAEARRITCRPIVTIGELEIRLEEYIVLLRGKPVPLTAKEFEVLSCLAAHPGKVFSREQIQEHLWGEGEIDPKTNSITVFVRRIREKIEDNPSEPRYLLTVNRVGYKMAETV